jgi:hypothetical protein
MTVLHNVPDDLLVKVATAAIEARDRWWEASLAKRDAAVAQATFDELVRRGRIRVEPVTRRSNRSRKEAR